MCTLRLDAFDTGKLIEVAIERHDGNGFRAGNRSVVRVHKVYIGLREILQRAQQNSLVLDFNPRGLNQAF